MLAKGTSGLLSQPGRYATRVELRTQQTSVLFHAVKQVSRCTIINTVIPFVSHSLPDKQCNLQILHIKKKHVHTACKHQHTLWKHGNRRAISPSFKSSRHTMHLTPEPSSSCSTAGAAAGEAEQAASPPCGADCLQVTHTASVSPAHAPTVHTSVSN